MPAFMGQRKDTPWTGFQSIKREIKSTFILVVSVESSFNLTARGRPEHLETIRRLHKERLENSNPGYSCSEVKVLTTALCYQKFRFVSPLDLFH